MNINATLVPKIGDLDLNYTDNGIYQTGTTTFTPNFNTWNIVDTVTRAWPQWGEMFDLVASPKCSFSNMVGFKDEKEYYRLELELPRFRKENIKLTAENNVLHVSAEQDNLKFYHSISIPMTLDTNTISAELDHGVLIVTAQKAEQAKQKTITIK